MSEAAVKKYVVRLSKDERSKLEDLISKGRHFAATILRARVLLKADVSEAGEGWSDSRIVKRWTPASPSSREYPSDWSRRASTPLWRESIPRIRPASASLTARRKQD
jgi:anti-sigma-K factor RskA